MRSLSLNETLSVTGAGFAEDSNISSLITDRHLAVFSFGCYFGLQTGLFVGQAIFGFSSVLASTVCPLVGAVLLSGIANYVSDPEVKQTLEAYFG